MSFFTNWPLNFQNMTPGGPQLYHLLSLNSFQAQTLLLKGLGKGATHFTCCKGSCKGGIIHVTRGQGCGKRATIHFTRGYFTLKDVGSISTTFPYFSNTTGRVFGLVYFTLLPVWNCLFLHANFLRFIFGQKCV